MKSYNIAFACFGLGSAFGAGVVFLGLRGEPVDSGKLKKLEERVESLNAWANSCGCHPCDNGDHHPKDAP